MRYLVLDGERLGDRAQAHAYLREKLELPGWYGANLDALADCLGELDEGTTVILTGADRLTQYAKRVRAVFEETAAAPHAFSFFAV